MISNGIDIICIKRFEKLINNKYFLNKYFTSNELEYIRKHNNNIATFAGIFASKEAFLKAIKKSLGSYSIKDIEVLHDENGCPYISLYNQIKKDIPFKSISLSISHDGEYAIASIIILF